MAGRFRGCASALSWLAVLAVSAAAQAEEKPLLFPAEQFGRAYLVMPQNTLNLENVLGRNANFERLVNYNESDQLRKLADPVGRLDLLISRNGQMGVTTCTASIISEKHILTNNHCSPNAKSSYDFVNAMLLMNFYSEDKESLTRKFKVKLKPLEQDAELDYAIYQVEGNPAARFGKVQIRPRDPAPGESLLIIHHPAGLPKHATRGGCRASAPEAVRGPDILHRCDTLPGSSGSPIFASNSGAMIGIHYAGASFSAPGSYNFGKRLSQIARKSPIIASILRAEAGRAATDDARQRAELERKLRAELEAKVRRQMDANEARDRTKLEAELRAQLEEKLRRSMAVDRKAERARIEAELRAELQKKLAAQRERDRAELRAHLEKELTEKFKRDRAAGSQTARAGPVAGAAVPRAARPVDPARLRAGPFAGEYRLNGVRVPLPGKNWYRIFEMKGKSRRTKSVQDTHGLARIDQGGDRDRTDAFFHGRRVSPCEVSDGKFVFADRTARKGELVVCWKFRRFSWNKYGGKFGDGIMDKLRRPSARFSYFVTEHGVEPVFYGFDFFIGTKGRYLRAFHLFNNAFANFDRKICCGRKAAMKDAIFALAERLKAALLSGMNGGDGHFGDARAVLDELATRQP